MSVDIETPANRQKTQLATLALDQEEAQLLGVCECPDIELTFNLLIKVEGKRQPLDEWSIEKVRKRVERIQAERRKSEPKAEKK
jgi:hypothetical protein